MSLRTLLSFAYTITGSSTIDSPLKVQKFTVTFDNATDDAAIDIGSKVDVSTKGSGFVVNKIPTGTSLQYTLWLVGFSGSRWVATDVVRDVDNSNNGVAAVDSDDATNASEHLCQYVSIINDTSAGGGANAVILVGDTQGNANVAPKNAVHAKDEYTVVTHRSYNVTVTGGTSQEVVVTLVQDI